MKAPAWVHKYSSNNTAMNIITMLLKTVYVHIAGQFLSKHVAVKQVESKTFRPRRSSPVTILTKTFAGEMSYFQLLLLLTSSSH